MDATPRWVAETLMKRWKKSRDEDAGKDVTFFARSRRPSDRDVPPEDLLLHSLPALPSMFLSFKGIQLREEGLVSSVSEFMRVEASEVLWSHYDPRYPEILNRRFSDRDGVFCLIREARLKGEFSEFPWEDSVIALKERAASYQDDALPLLRLGMERLNGTSK